MQHSSAGQRSGGRRLFGTDGIRGRVGVFPITPQFVLRLGWAAGRVLSRNGRGLVVIGKDTRISGYMFESALEAGLAAAGVAVRLLGPMPTPAVAYLTRTLHADAGIVISASHNPHHDNGIKFFSGEGKKLSDELEAAIEAELDREMQVVGSGSLGKAQRVEDAAGRYIEFCKSTFPYPLDLKGLSIVLDCAHGAGYHVAPSVFRELGARVHAIGVEPDGLNINADCGSTRPEHLQREVLARGADLGIGLDGDGDRVIMVDEAGDVVDGDELLFIIARDRARQSRCAGGVVGTLMSNFGMERALRELGIAFERAKVGDRHVLERLVANGWLLGGESSGHILCLDRTSTGDGIVSALQVLAAMVREQRSLRDLKSAMRKFPQCMVNVPLLPGFDLNACSEVGALVREAEAALSGNGRVLLRPSGTEPVVRVMVEGEDAATVEGLAHDLAARLRAVMEGAEQAEDVAV